MPSPPPHKWLNRTACNSSVMLARNNAAGTFIGGPRREMAPAKRGRFIRQRDRSQRGGIDHGLTRRKCDAKEKQVTGSGCS